MASFISAGHHNKDSGAIGSGTQENWEAKKFRDLVVPHAKKLGVKVITDDDNETLSEYLKRIQSGLGSVVVEFHFDAANGTASGSTAIVGVDADRLDKSFAQELVDLTAKILGIKNRGVKSEAQSHRGRLGLMREQGIVCLLEICFIDNQNDMNAFNKNKELLALEVAKVIDKFDRIVL
jgi:N-acetylmuramoyl-L-alanine amidase